MSAIAAAPRQASGTRTAPRPLALGPGLIVAAIVLAIYGGLALSVDFPHAAFGFQSDEATYYMMAHSLARDGDLEYRREDLVRVWREFPSGPSGVFLKQGRSVGVRVSGAFPFFHVRFGPDPDAGRLYYGKSYMYPLIAAPFVRVFGTSGFLVLHAMLLALVVLAAYLFLAARSPAAIAAVLASGFFFASVIPGYVVWLTPELFNLVAVTLAYFCWLYKEVAPSTVPRGVGWLLRPRSDLAAVALLAVATFSKPSNAILILPLVAFFVWRRRWRRAVLVGTLFAAVVGGLFLANLLITGDWNFQGGDRNTYYSAFPFLTASTGFDVGLDRATNEVLTDIVFDPTVFWSRLGWNLMYFVIGRHSGLLPYFFPGLFAVVAFLWPRTRREGWQWLVALAAAAQVLLVVVWIPYNYFGGGGVLGNRYFMSTYGLLLFLLPPIESVGVSLVPWFIGSLFTAQIVLNAFSASFNPAEHAKSGPLRLLPVEMTMLNTLPITTRTDRVRVLFGTSPRFQIYFLDDNAFPREGDGFWLRGDSRADLIIKTVDAARTLRFTLSGGDAPAKVVVRGDGQSVSRPLAAGEHAVVDLPLSHGFPYEGARAWYVTLDVTGGFVPLFTQGGQDNRYLGVLVKPELVP
jgi:hypothetical protein